MAWPRLTRWPRERTSERVGLKLCPSEKGDARAKKGSVHLHNLLLSSSLKKRMDIFGKLCAPVRLRAYIMRKQETSESLDFGPVVVAVVVLELVLGEGVL